MKVARGLPVLWLFLCATTAVAQIPTNELPVRIGDDQAGGNTFHGEIAAVRLYNRNLHGGAEEPGAGRSGSQEQGGGTCR